MSKTRLLVLSCGCNIPFFRHIVEKIRLSVQALVVRVAVLETTLKVLVIGLYATLPLAKGY